MHGLEVIAKVADGATAEVFLALEKAKQRHVLLEVIRPELRHQMQLYGGFLDAVKGRSGLTHPSLISRRRSGCAPDGRLFTVSEPVEAESLADLLRARGPRPVREALSIVSAICDAVEYLHGSGEVHGYIAPANVYFAGPAAAPAPKLLDVGLLLLRGRRSAVPPRGLVLIPPEYLSPERILGRRATPASDVYGLGVLLYELLTGSPPLQGQTSDETRRRQLEDSPAPLPESCARLDPLLRRCLAKSPADRPESARALRAFLRDHTADHEQTDPQHHSALVKLLDDEPTLPRVRPPGERLGSYELEELLGRGGMGCIYRARHTLLDRPVALKLLRPEFAREPSHLHRFFREAQAVNRINHEHIVEIYDFVEEPRGQAFCVMELLHGETLKALSSREPLKLVRAVSIVRQVCAALQASHSVGVIHRDIKPDNIFLIERDGRRDFVKVLDFGVAKLRAWSESAPVEATRQGAVLGTPAFMAPEQAKGEEVDHRADVYSVATVLYTLLAGEPPFHGPSVGQVVAAVINRPPPRLPATSVAGEPIPPALDALVMRCLAKAPEHRLQSMVELSSALAAFEGRTGGSSTARRAARTGPRRPQRWVFWLVLGLTTGALIPAVGRALQEWREVRRGAAPQEVRLMAAEPLTPEPEKKPVKAKRTKRPRAR